MWVGHIVECEIQDVETATLSFRIRHDDRDMSVESPVLVVRP